MALNAYWMEVTGEKQGKFKGGVIQKGREGWIEIIALNHTITSPRDVASGQATGKRTHKPIRARHLYDQSITQWYQALVLNEALKTCTIDFFSPNKLGKRRWRDSPPVLTTRTGTLASLEGSRSRRNPRHGSGGTTRGKGRRRDAGNDRDRHPLATGDHLDRSDRPTVPVRWIRNPPGDLGRGR
jgi:hypothetical protein